MSKKTAAAGNIAALLRKNAAPKKAKKSDNPELDFHNADETILCGNCKAANKPSDGGWNCTRCDEPLSLTDRVYHAYQAVKNAEGIYASLEAQLLEQVVPEYEAHAKGEFSKTFNVAGRETAGVQVSFKDMFKKIPLEQEETLQKIMGSRYDDYFYQKREISMVDTSDAAIAALLEDLGEEKFAKYFKIDLSVGTKQDMDRRQFELPPQARLAVQQYKGAVKIRKED